MRTGSTRRRYVGDVKAVYQFCARARDVNAGKFGAGFNIFSTFKTTVPLEILGGRGKVLACAPE